MLGSGEVELYVSYNNQDLILDTLTVTGSAMGAQNILTKQKFTYFARAKSDVHILTITCEDLDNLKANITDLENNIARVLDDQDKEGMPILDYQKHP